MADKAQQQANGNANGNANANANANSNGNGNGNAAPPPSGNDANQGQNNSPKAPGSDATNNTSASQGQGQGQSTVQSGFERLFGLLDKATNAAPQAAAAAAAAPPGTTTASQPQNIPAQTAAPPQANTNANSQVFVGGKPSVDASASANANANAADDDIDEFGVPKSVKEKAERDEYERNTPSELRSIARLFNFTPNEMKNFTPDQKDKMKAFYETLSVEANRNATMEKELLSLREKEQKAVEMITPVIETHEKFKSAINEVYHKLRDNRPGGRPPSDPVAYVSKLGDELKKRNAEVLSLQNEIEQLKTDLEVNDRVGKRARNGPFNSSSHGDDSVGGNNNNRGNASYTNNNNNGPANNNNNNNPSSSFWSKFMPQSEVAYSHQMNGGRQGHNSQQQPPQWASNIRDPFAASLIQDMGQMNVPTFGGTTPSVFTPLPGGVKIVPWSG